MTFDSNDVISLALCAWKEARGEGADGMRAVMQVICNRAIAWYNCRIHDAVFAKNQFTSMSVPSDPEFDLKPASDDPEYAFCLGIATDVIMGEDDDLIHGALYYANLPQVTSGWFFENIIQKPAEHPQLAVIGKQTFFA